MADFLFSEGPIRALQEASTPFLDALFVIITNTGSALFIFAAILLVYWLWDKRLGFLLSVLLLVSAALNLYLKVLFGSPRPPAALHKPVPLLDNGFPSGHAQTTTAFWTAIALALRGWWIVIAVVMTALVALSRVYLGVHFIGDVLGGVAIGLGLGVVAYATSRGAFWERLGLRARLLLAVALPAVLGGVFLLLGQDISLLWGLLTGLWVGYVLEERWVGLERASSAGSMGIRVLLGLPIVGGLFVTGAGLTNPLLVWPFFLVLGLSVALILPWAFRRLEGALLKARG